MTESFQFHGAQDRLKLKRQQIKDKLQSSGKRENLRKKAIVCQVIMVQCLGFYSKLSLSVVNVLSFEL